MNDLTGKKFNRLTVLRLEKKEPRKHATWVCVCECGEIRSYDHYNLTKGRSQSCGCLCAERTSEASKTHGATVGKKTSEYKIWLGIKDRCLNQRSVNWAAYGGRGITMCKRWQKSFEHFLMDVGLRPARMSLDRKDNDKGYEPGNCQWATSRQQANNRRSNHFITYKGQTKTMSQWSREIGIGIGTIHKRIRNGWPVEKAFTTIPVDCWNDIQKRLL